MDGGGSGSPVNGSPHRAPNGRRALSFILGDLQVTPNYYSKETCDADIRMCLSANEITDPGGAP